MPFLSGSSVNFGDSSTNLGFFTPSNITSANFNFIPYSSAGNFGGASGLPYINGQIQDLITQEVLNFQFLNNDSSFNESKDASWDAIDIIGRSHPVRAYRSSNARKIDLELVFHALPTQDSNFTADDVRDKVNFLKSLVYPDYDHSLPSPPHTVILTIGNFIGMTAIVTSVSVKWSGPYDVNTTAPHHAEVHVSLEEVRAEPISTKEVREFQGGGSL